MTYVGRELLKSIYQGKWMDINYQNKDNNQTRYWIKVNEIDVGSKKLRVQAFNLSINIKAIDITIFYDSILSAEVIKGSYHELNEELISDIHENPERYKEFFIDSNDSKVLDYLDDCHFNNVTPYRSTFVMVDGIDEDTLIENDYYDLTDTQFRSIASSFQNRLNTKSKYFNYTELGLNVLSVSLPKNKLYVLAYKKLDLDVENKRLVIDKELVVNREFIDDDKRFSILKYISEDSSYLIDDFEDNLEDIIKEMTTYGEVNQTNITDSPFVIEVGRRNLINLRREYSYIEQQIAEDILSIPLKAFFGKMKKKPDRRKSYPIVLKDNQINIDQLLAIHKAIKYPLAYIQGPPGTGKTNTILNLIVTGFFNKKTMLVASNNNHPMDNILDDIRELKYRERPLPFPILRLGNQSKVLEAIDGIKRLREVVKKLSVYESSLDKMKSLKEEQRKELEDLLDKYETKLDLEKRLDAINEIIENSENFDFSVNIQTGQKANIEKELHELGDINEDDALEFFNEDNNDFMKYLYYESVRYIQRLEEPKYEEFNTILEIEDSQDRVRQFNNYIGVDEKLKMLMRVFPIIVSTNLSSCHLGNPKEHFDMVVLDEASQCDQATSLIPIVRGKQLMLVGDPQQLNPVVVLGKRLNHYLMNEHKVPKEYDYIENSIYKTYISLDPFSDEFLLKYHYRCNEKIIGFNNMKYYNNKLIIKSNDKTEEPLTLIPNTLSTYVSKNTSIAEMNDIIDYIKNHPDDDIGVITPFVAQKDLIDQGLIEANLQENIPCGTVHTFQGDQKKVILFSCAITDQTRQSTYNWLKNNRELINVAVSRAKSKFIMYLNEEALEKLNLSNKDNDFYDLYKYVKEKGSVKVSQNSYNSTALGIKPYSSEIADHFHKNLEQALSVVEKNSVIKNDVPISELININKEDLKLFKSNTFSFVVYTKDKDTEIPKFAIELKGLENESEDMILERDNLKTKFCEDLGFKLIIVQNVFARRYGIIKDLLADYFS